MVSPLNWVINLSDTQDARAMAAYVVNMVTEQGRALDDALESVQANGGVAERDRALVRELSYGVLRWYQRLAYRANENLHKPVKSRDRDLWALILVGLYQLEFMRVPSHAAVNATVAAAQSLGKPWAKGLLNAVLRSAERKAWMPEKLPATVQWAHPEWMYAAIAADWPQHVDAILQANNTRPPMYLRVNLARTSREGYLRRLQEIGLSADIDSAVESAITLNTPVPVDQLPGFFDEGLVSVQDIAAQKVAELVAAQDGDRVLDACAAPGGKSAHLLERSHIELFAIDIDEERLDRVRDTLDRLRLQGTVLAADATDPRNWWDGKSYQRILLDAPCSGTGVIRRHPDIKHLRRPDDIPAFAERQGRLLDALWPLLDTCGVLTYVTCSILHAENDAVISAFLHRTADAELHPVSGVPPGVTTESGYQALPGVHPGDGFYYTRLRHKA